MNGYQRCAGAVYTVCAFGWMSSYGMEKRELVLATPQISRRILRERYTELADSKLVCHDKGLQLYGEIKDQTHEEKQAADAGTVKTFLQRTMHRKDSAWYDTFQYSSQPVRTTITAAAALLALDGYPVPLRALTKKCLGKDGEEAVAQRMVDTNEKFILLARHEYPKGGCRRNMSFTQQAFVVDTFSEGSTDCTFNLINGTSSTIDVLNKWQVVLLERGLDPLNTKYKDLREIWDTIDVDSHPPIAGDTPEERHFTCEDKHGVLIVNKAPAYLKNKFMVDGVIGGLYRSCNGHCLVRVNGDKVTLFRHDGLSVFTIPDKWHDNMLCLQTLDGTIVVLEDDENEKRRIKGYNPNTAALVYDLELPAYPSEALGVSAFGQDSCALVYKDRLDIINSEGTIRSLVKFTTPVELEDIRIENYGEQFILMDRSQALVFDPNGGTLQKLPLELVPMPGKLHNLQIRRYENYLALYHCHPDNFDYPSTTHLFVKKPSHTINTIDEALLYSSASGCSLSNMISESKIPYLIDEGSDEASVYKEFPGSIRDRLEVSNKVIRGPGSVPKKTNPLCVIS